VDAGDCPYDPGSGLCGDSDGDGIMDWLDPDFASNDADDDGDGIPNFLDPHYHIYLPLTLRSST